MNTNVKKFISEGRKAGFQFFMPTDDGVEVEVFEGDKDFWPAHAGEECALAYYNNGLISMKSLSNNFTRYVRVLRGATERELINFTCELYRPQYHK